MKDEHAKQIVRQLKEIDKTLYLMLFFIIMAVMTYLARGCPS